MENISFSALNSLPLPLLALIYFTLFLAVLTIGCNVYLKIIQNSIGLKLKIAYLLLVVKKWIRSSLLRKPTTRYNMVDYPSSEPEIPSELLDAQDLVLPSSSNIESQSEIHQENSPEQKSEIIARKPRSKKLSNGKIVNTSIS